MVFKALHHDPDGPLLLPNAWDHASAAALAGQGFAAIGTTSLGVAAAAGLPDGHAATREETLRLARRLGGGAFLLSVDGEGGFSDDPAEVAGLARELARAGAVGINLEDGRADGTLTPAPSTRRRSPRSRPPYRTCSSTPARTRTGSRTRGPRRSRRPGAGSTPTGRRAPTASSYRV